MPKQSPACCNFVQVYTIDEEQIIQISILQLDAPRSHKNLYKSNDYFSQLYVRTLSYSNGGLMLMRY